jgi:hypothetical protein
VRLPKLSCFERGLVACGSDAFEAPLVLRIDTSRDLAPLLFVQHTGAFGACPVVVIRTSAPDTLSPSPSSSSSSFDVAMIVGGNPLHFLQEVLPLWAPYTVAEPEHERVAPALRVWRTTLAPPAQRARTLLLRYHRRWRGGREGSVSHRLRQ